MGDARFRILRHGPPVRRYFWVHGNEQTARDVLEAHLPGRAALAVLTTSSVRYVPCEGGRLDPNRMFSRTGAEKSLKSLNAEWTPDRMTKALNRLDHDRKQFLKLLLPSDGGLLVALHNNSEGYSVRDEVDISDEVSLKRPGEPHEFMLCTSLADYVRLARSPYNVVLQNKTPPEDDGSLSRLAALRGVRYVNIEVALGKREMQAEMLRWLEEHLP